MEVLGVREVWGVRSEGSVEVLELREVAVLW